MNGYWSSDDFEGIQATYEYDWSNFLRVLDESKGYLLELDNEKRMEVVRELAKNPNFDDTDVYYLVMIELQNSCKNRVVNACSVHGERFVRQNEISLASPCNVSNGEKIKPVGETTSSVTIPVSEVEVPRVENLEKPVSDGELDYEEKARAKKEVNKTTDVVLPNQPPELPQNFKEYIRNLNGSEAILVIEK
ncbi:hypothetical protein Acr_00g0091540 [Actinidia rufa]|uniref:Uncharacterized protein n=1 Tax=Actinidia rufa TaxID=165716 RepID=A0A7J0DZ15_9ERIC|nr:hypothetical protein Acr_00g0091540 [Actinidia rufa]